MPWDGFSSVFHHILQKRVELQRANQMQGHPWSTKLSQILNANSSGIDFDLTWLQCRLIIEFKLELLIERLRPAHFCAVDRVFPALCLVKRFSSLLHSQLTDIVQLPEPRNDSLPRTAGRTVRLNQRPVRMSLTVLCPKLLSDKHDEACYRHFQARQEDCSSLHHISDGFQTTY